MASSEMHQVEHLPTGDIQSELFVPDDPTYSSETFLTMLALINDTPPKHVTALQSYYASALVTLFPDLEDLIRQVLLLNNITLVNITLPSQAKENFIQMSKNGAPSKVIIMLGQLLLIPYKNFTGEAHYQNFITKRIMAMRSFNGVPSSETELRAILEVEKVAAIRSIFGHHVTFRQTLLRVILAGCNDPYPFGSLFTHISEILSWTDMSAFKFIADTLFQHPSPVLQDYRVQNEVRAMDEALCVVTKYEYPQFYRILGPKRGQALLALSKFPYLLAVAQRVKSEVYFTTVKQFGTTVHRNHPIVRDLCDIHKRYLRSSNHNSAALEFLYTFSIEGGNVQAFESAAGATLSNIASCGGQNANATQ